MTNDLLTTRPGVSSDSNLRALLNKVPEVTLYFWVIKIMATTVGETAADFLSFTLGWGLTGTSVVMSVLLAAALWWQLRARRYVPVRYWTAVVMISIVGTLLTDNLTDKLGVPLTVSTTVFAVALAVVFTVWYRSERTLSIHTITSTRREAFYWAAILMTFALGTAAGDLLGEGLALGYGVSALLFGAAIALITVAHLRFRLGAVVAFWAAYILTRPLGASLGDLLSQSRPDGGIGLGTVGTTAVFLTTILALVTWLSFTRRDATEVVLADHHREVEPVQD